MNCTETVWTLEKAEELASGRMHRKRGETWLQIRKLTVDERERSSRPGQMVSWWSGLPNTRLSQMSGGITAERCACPICKVTQQGHGARFTIDLLPTDGAAAGVPAERYIDC